jgi:alkylmercury lyase
MTDPARDCCCDPEPLRHDMTDAGLELAVAGFVALWYGDRRPPSQLLPHLADAERVAADLARRGRAELDDHGNLVSIHGLTLRTTRHRITTAGRTHHTWCAFDSIGIPAALGLDAVAHSDCPACGRHLHIRIHEGEPEASDAVLWLPTGSITNLIADFCARADLYCNPDHLGRAIDTERVPGDVTGLAAAAALGGGTWTDIADIAAEAIRPADAP